MEFKDYYETLGVDRSADAAAIKKAYRKLARKYHPDVSKEADAKQRMPQVNEAYAVLSDPEKRAAYDALSRGRQAGQDFEPPPNWDAGFEFSGDGAYAGQSDDFSDFFASLFGRAGAGQYSGDHPLRGGDHHAKIVIDLDDAYHGATRTISLRTSRADANGRVASEERAVNVQIPKGVREGQYIRLAGQGALGRGGGQPGDLYLEVHFAPHARYHVQGRDVFESVPVAPWEAALGAGIEVPTPSGRVQVNVPAGSRHGRKLRLRGRGIPGDPPGDLYLVLEIVLPPADTDKARELYRSMARDLSFDPRREFEA